MVVKITNQILDWCVAVLVYWATVLGVTYKEINVWVFIIVWPVVTMALLKIHSLSSILAPHSNPRGVKT
jgi:hypothetical protein